MILKSIKYEEYAGKPNEWTTPAVGLQKINLFVGKNATGKSRILNVIGGLASFLTGRIAPSAFPSGHYVAAFEDAEGVRKIRYELKYENREVQKERMEVDGKVMLSRRQDGTAALQHRKPDRRITVHTPGGQLVAFTRRDPLQHPYFEELHGWAQAVRHYRFGLNLGMPAMEVPNLSGQPSSSFEDANAANVVIGVYRYAEKKFGKRFKKRLMEDLARIGYAVDDIGLGNYTGAEIKYGSFTGNPLMLFIRESNLKHPIFHQDMSLGLSRAFVLLILVTANILEKSASSILVDDIGEGLDYDRAVKLINLLINRAEKEAIQLVMSTNDRFVMNEVPLSYWNVVTRDGPKITVFNEATSKSAFDQFKGIGLSNFDFFTSEAFLGSSHAHKKTSPIRRGAN